MADQNPNPGAPQAEDYIDESGWTSVEPEGAGKHPHHEEIYPDPGSKERWEVDLGGEPGGKEEGAIEEDALARGPKPVEGDGDGAPL
jgi:hypothetical protein